MKTWSLSIFLKILLPSLGICTSTFYYHSQAEEINSIIKYFCLESVKDEMIAHSNQIDNKIAEHTCNCFLERINNGEKLEPAKEICKTQTSIEFNL